MCSIEDCTKQVNKDGLCLRHKLLRVNIATVPGGAKDSRNNIAYGKQVEKNLTRFEDRSKAGERPSGLSEKSVKRDRKFQDIAERRPDLAAQAGFPELA